MGIREWDARYRSASRPLEDLEAQPNPLVIESVKGLKPGRALDLACGAGRNALWLAERGWSVTAIDGSPAAIEILRERAAARGLDIDARIADLEKGEYRIDESAWDLIVICLYLQRDLFTPAKRGLAPGGVLVAIVHITDPSGENGEASQHRLKPGELRDYFRGWEITHDREGASEDPAHCRVSAEIVVRRP
jgi:SAM-dependent methyltransferase